MFQGVVQHIKGQVPTSSNIPRQVGDAHTKPFQDVMPGWKDNGCRVNVFKAKFMELITLLDPPLCQSFPCVLCLALVGMSVDSIELSSS